jgi:DNA adenine methylase
MQDNFHFSEVRPVSPPAAYLGGKKQLAARIASMLEQIPHDLYAEPFTGMGGVFFRRRLVPCAEPSTTQGAKSDKDGNFYIVEIFM